MRILIVNGPNLNLLGEREQAIYGKQSFEDYLDILSELFRDYEIDYFQSNWEGGIVDRLHEAADNYDGILINPAGYTHTSVAIADAIRAIKIPVVEVHISHILDRETFRHKSVTAAQCRGVIMGFGLDSYRLGIESLRVLLKNKSK
ncbi:MAG: type II 3-dehydroquinate dehydratase [Bacteroidales bacterium]|nr:type II 3-dehydroquinate dehydratase [Bacteroidales bacterium]